MLYIEILKKKAKWYWRLVARNGKILAHSEQYCSKASARKTAEWVRVRRNTLIIR